MSEKVVSIARKPLLTRIDDMITELRDIQQGKVQCSDCEGCGAQADPEILELSHQQVAAMKARDDKKRDEIIEKIQELIKDGRHEEYTCPECEGTGKKQDFATGYKILALEQAKQAINALVERIEDLDTRSEESDSFDTGHHLAIREVLALIQNKESTA